MADVTPSLPPLDDPAARQVGPRRKTAAAAAAPPPGELEIRRRVERLFFRELSDPSEELVHFVSSRLGIEVADTPPRQLSELCRRALRDIGRERWSRRTTTTDRALDRRQLDRRRFEQNRAIPGYYLG